MRLHKHNILTCHKNINRFLSMQNHYHHLRRLFKTDPTTHPNSSASAHSNNVPQHLTFLLIVRARCFMQHRISLFLHPKMPSPPFSTITTANASTFHPASNNGQFAHCPRIGYAPTVKAPKMYKMRKCGCFLSFSSNIA